MKPTPLRRQAFVMGVSSFGAGLGPLDRAVDHARDFGELLRGVFHFDTESLLDPTCTEMDCALSRAAASQAAAVVVHVLSHGEWVRVGDALWVASRDAGRLVRSTGWIDLRSWLAAAVNDHPEGPPILVVLDVCSAGSAAGYEWLAQRAEQEERRVWVIGATEEGHSAYGARFTRAMRAVLQRLADGALDSLDPSQEFMSLDLLSTETWHELKNLVDAERGMPQRLTPSVRELGVIDSPPLFPNPSYRRDPLRAAGVEPALAALADDVLDVQHFGSRAAGAPAGAAPGGCCFTGRRSELTVLSGWINEGAAAPGALRVVTGSPGAGKSALLGALVCLAHPELAAYAGPLRNRIPQRIAPYLQYRGSIAAVHARNRTFDELVASICRQWGITIPREDRPAVEHLRQQVRHRPVPPLLVVDALDEALDPVGVMLGLLVPLVSTPDGSPLCRMVIGSRPWRPQFGTLLDLASPDGLVDLDRADRGQLVEDVCDYVLDLHREFLAGPLGIGENPKAWEETARVIAETVTSGPGDAEVEVGPFLLAQLYVHHLHRSGAAPTMDTAADIGAAAPTFIGQVLTLDLDRPRTSRWMRPLLISVAHARGAGMPMMLIRTVAEAIAAPLAPADPAEWSSAADQAMFYLRGSVDIDGSTLYRLFHQGLISTLTRQPTRQGSMDTSPTPPASRGSDHGSTALTEQAVFEAMRAVAAPAADHPGYRDELAVPYLRRHLAGHAATAGRLDELIVDPEFLVHADPDTLTPLLTDVRTVPGRLAAAVYRTSLGRHRYVDPDTRRGLLTLDAQRFGEPNLAANLDPSNRRGRVRWATGSQISAQLRNVLTGHTNFVAAVTCTVLDGRPVAVTGGHDGTVRVWDLTTGRPLGEPMTGHSDIVRSVACTVLDGRPVAVTGGEDGTVRVWDVTTGRPLREPMTGHNNGVPSAPPTTPDGQPIAARGGGEGAVAAVACTVLDGRPVAVTAGGDGTVRIWNPATGQQMGPPMTGHNGHIWSMACTVLDGRPVAVTAGGDGTAQMWDLATGLPVGEPMTGHTRRVTSVACTVLDGRPVAVTGGQDGTVRVWDLATGQPVGQPLTGHDLFVAAVACTVLDGRPVAVTAGGDGPVRVWDLATGLPVGEPLTGHDVVVAVACTLLDGRPVVVTGGGDGDVRVWDLRTSAPLGHRRTGHTSTVGAAACTVLDGRPVAVTAGADRTVRVWDLTTGQPVGQPMTGHTNSVAGLACTVLDGRPVAVTAGVDRTVRVWDLTAGRPIGEHRGVVNAVACTVLDGRPLVVADGQDGTVRVWDLTTGRPIGEPIATHADVVVAVACTVLDGRPVAVTAGGHFVHHRQLQRPSDAAAATGGGDRIVRVWDLATGRPVRDPLTGPTRAVTSVACVLLDGRPLVVTAGLDGTVRSWDLATGRPLGDPLTGHTGRVTSVACTVLDGRPVAVTAGDDRTVRVWNLTTGAEVMTIALPMQVRSVATAPGAIVAGFGSEVAVFDVPGLAGDHP